jgi:hypothetical protein
MTTKPKSLGREKAKENTFIELQTEPADYEPDFNYLKIWDFSKNCQLCGQHIEYDFLLKHKSKPEKNLYVGSDCIVTFCRTHVPNVAESLLLKMKMQMEVLVEQRKAEVFVKNYPTFEIDCSRLRKEMNEKIMELNLYRDFNYGKLKLPIMEIIADAQANFRKSKYTTKPKVEEIYYQLKEVESGRFAQKLQEYIDNKKSDKTIEQDINPNNKEIYDTYLKYAKFMRWEKNHPHYTSKDHPTFQSKALSDLEKEIFLDSAEEYLSSRSRNKKKLVKNKKEVFERIRKEISDSRLVFEKIENRKRSFDYISDAKLKSEISQYQVFFERTKLCRIPGRVIDDLETYGLSSLKEFFGKPVEHYAELGKAEDHYVYTSEYILFKEEHSAVRFIDNLKSVIESKIQQIEDYLSSDHVVSEDFN